MSDETVKVPDYAQQFDLFNKLYQALSSSVNGMPVLQRYKDLIAQNLDQGFMWAREAYSILIQQQQASNVETLAAVKAEDDVPVADAANDH